MTDVGCFTRGPIRGSFHDENLENIGIRTIFLGNWIAGILGISS